MPRIPEEFSNEFEDKGDTFFEIGELLYTQPDRQFTQTELAEKIGLTTSRVSDHTQDMTKEGWIDPQKNQTTYSWNTDVHNPASTEGFTAVKLFYIDLYDLLKKHTDTVPGAFAIVGFAFILTAVVIFAYSVGVSSGITRDPSISVTIYLGIAIGAFVTGVIMTFFSPIQAFVNRIVEYIIPKNYLRRD